MVVIDSDVNEPMSGIYDFWFSPLVSSLQLMTQTHA